MDVVEPAIGPEDRNGTEAVGLEQQVYDTEAEVEADHWWFVARRKLFARKIRRLGLPAEALILDAGTSTGTNLRMLRDMGFVNAIGLDLSDNALAYCRQKELGILCRGDVAKTPFADATFDLVLATDIVEHVEDDHAALIELKRVARPGARLLVTVPAFTCLWGPQDEVSHHKRRYRRAGFLDLFRAANLPVRESFYFNFLLFLPIFVARKLLLLANQRTRSENHLNNRLLNTLLLALFSFDCYLAPKIRPPLGVSIFALAERTPD